MRGTVDLILVKIIFNYLKFYSPKVFALSYLIFSLVPLHEYRPPNHHQVKIGIIGGLAVRWIWVGSDGWHITGFKSSGDAG